MGGMNSFADDDKQTDSIRKTTSVFQPRQRALPDSLQHPGMQRIAEWALSHEKKVRSDMQEFNRLKKKESDLVKSLIRGIPKDGFSGAAKKALT